jgi:hypothetical protein
VTTKRQNSSFNLCQFQYADGRLCGLPALDSLKGYCRSHATLKSRSIHREDDLSTDLASPLGEYISQIEINHVLGKLFESLAANRVSAKRAATLAYIAQLLLQSQQGGKEEARRWPIDNSTFKQWLDIKAPFRPKPPKPEQELATHPSKSPSVETTK